MVIDSISRPWKATIHECHSSTPHMSTVAQRFACKLHKISFMYKGRNLITEMEFGSVLRELNSRNCFTCKL